MHQANCKNCGQLAERNFCAHCGQKTKIQPLSLSSIAKDTLDNIFQINHGLFYSLIEFSRRPAQSISNYLTGKRKQYFPPIAYAFTLASFYFLLSQIVNHNTFIDGVLAGIELASNDDVNDKVLISSVAWLAKHYSLVALLLIPLFSLGTFIAFYSERRNYVEHLVLNLYLTGHQSLIYALFALSSLVYSNSDVIETLTLISSVAYACFVLTTFFNKHSFFFLIIKVGVSYLIALTLIACLYLIWLVYATHV